MFKKISVSFLLVLILLSAVFPVSAAVTDSYTRIQAPGESEILLSREMYKATETLDSGKLGLNENLDGITDIFSNDGKVFLLCGDASRLIALNGDYTEAKELTVSDADGKVDYTGAQGVYFDGENIYIADTSNSRIIITDLNGNITKILTSPESDLIPSDFLFQPVEVEKDNEGYVYVLSLGCYYGALMYTPEYEFMGFYGANTVETSALDTLSYIWDKIVSTEAKKSVSVKTLPYSFTDFSFDREGYMVTITGAITNNKYAGASTKGQIKKITCNGDNILYKRNINGDSESSSNVNFLESQKPEGADVQNFVSVAVNEDGYIYVLDSGNGTIYIYDSECNLMSAFGGGYGSGNQAGVFQKATSITIDGSRLLVADKTTNSVTVFEETDYGKKLFKAQSLYLEGDYEQAKDLWKEILSLNKNCQLAYRGMAMVYYNEGDYKAALNAAKISYDYSVYDMAWQELISNFISRNFIAILVIVVFLFALIFFTVKNVKKRKGNLIKNSELKLMLNVVIHPFESFDDLKYKGLGSVKYAIVLTGAFYVVTFLNIIAGGFLYSNTLLKNYNSLYTLGSTIGLILLWSLCNWLVCSIFSGKGSFKEVYISTCYSLIPLIVFRLIKVILTNFLPLSSSGLITGLETALVMYTFFLLAVAMMKIHEYDFFKFLSTGVVTVFFMILVVFILFMCAILVAQFWSFIVSIYEEVAYR